MGGYIYVRLLAVTASLVCLPHSAIADPAVISGVATIVDGDTIDVGVVRIRLHGIDAPEAGQKCGKANGGSWPCGTEATKRLASLVEDKPVECEALDKDVYGRIIGVCRVDGEDVNAVLAEEGLAWAYVRFSDDYLDHEQAAQAAGLGVWQGEAEAPWDYRANKWERAAAASPREGCPIKGNINSSGEKIYHTPWSPWYDRTRIDEARGQRWFCDENEATEAGWRAARWR